MIAQLLAQLRDPSRSRVYSGRPMARPEGTLLRALAEASTNTKEA